MFDSLTLETINKIYNKLEESISEKHTTLLILDDVGASLKNNEIQKIPKYNDLKVNPEIVLMVCNCVENIINTKKDGCNKKDIVIEVIKQFLI